MKVRIVQTKRQEKRHLQTGPVNGGARRMAMTQSVGISVSLEDIYLRSPRHIRHMKVT